MNTRMSFRSPSRANPESSLGHNEEIMQLFGEINRTFEKLSLLPDADRLCEDTLSMTASIDSKLMILIYLAAKDDENWKKCGRDDPEDSLPCLADSMIIYALCNRAMQDTPRGSLPMLLNTLSSVIEHADYPLVKVRSVYEPLGQLISAALRYETLFDNCFDEDAQIYADYLDRIDLALTGLLLSIWKKIAADGSCLEGFVPVSSSGGSGSIDILTALFVLVCKPSCFQAAHQCLLLACNTADLRILAYFSSRHDYMRHWIVGLTGSFEQALDCLQEHIPVLCKIPDHMKVFMPIDLSSAMRHSLTHNDALSEEDRDEERRAIMLDKIHCCLRFLTLIVSVHSTLLRNARYPLISLRLPKGTKAEARWVAISHIAHGFASEFLSPLTDMILQCGEDAEVTASYFLLGLMLNTMHQFAPISCSQHVLDEDDREINWNHAEQSLLSLFLRHILKSMLLDLAWGRLTSLSSNVAVTATVFLTSVMLTAPPLAKLAFLFGTANQEGSQKGRNPLFRALSQSRPLVSFHGAFSSSLHTVCESSIQCLRRQRLVQHDQPIMSMLKQYAVLISQDAMAAIRSEGDALLAHSVDFFDQYRNSRFRSHDMDSGHHSLLVTSGDGSFLDRLSRRFTTFHQMHIHEQIVLSGLLQKALVPIAVVMILGSENVAKQHLAVLQQVLIEMENVRTILLGELTSTDQVLTAAAALAVHQFLQKEGVLLLQAPKKRKYKPVEPDPEPVNEPPPTPTRSAVSSFFSMFSTPVKEAPAPLTQVTSSRKAEPVQKSLYPELRPFDQHEDHHTVLGLVMLDEMYMETLSCLIAVQKLRDVFHSDSILHSTIWSKGGETMQSEHDDWADPPIAPLSPSPAIDLELLEEGGKGMESPVQMCSSPSSTSKWSLDTIAEAFEEEFANELVAFASLVIAEVSA